MKLNAPVALNSWPQPWRGEKSSAPRYTPTPMASSAHSSSVICARHDPFEQPDGNADQQHAEHRLYVVHPRTGARQQLRAARTDHQQRNTHTETQREQRAAAEQRIARGTDDNQRSGQRRRKTRRHHETRQTAHHRNTGVFAAALVLRQRSSRGSATLRQLQLIETEHRQREQYEDDRKADQHGRRLQRRLQIHAGAEHTRRGRRASHT